MCYASQNNKSTSELSAKQRKEMVDDITKGEYEEVAEEAVTELFADNLFHDNLLIQNV